MKEYKPQKFIMSEIRVSGLDTSGFRIFLFIAGAAIGWNNIAGARKYETLVERFLRMRNFTPFFSMITCLQMLISSMMYLEH